MSNARTLASLIDDTNTRIKIPSGYGLDFAGYGAEDSNSATTVGSNLMDDYEEGTWTPTLNTGTPVQQNGLYIKIGNFVWLTGQVSYTITDTSTNYLRMGGLPFTIPSDADNRGYQVMFASGVTGLHAWETYDGNGGLALAKDGTTFSGNRSVFSDVQFNFKFTYPASVI